MGDYEDSKNELKEVLRSIQSAEDLKENRERFIETQENFFKSCAVTLKEFFDNLPNYTPEEKKAQVERFSDEKFINDDEINEEMIRIYELPDSEDLLSSIDSEVQERCEPYLNEYMMLLQTKMVELMNELMGVMAPVMDAMVQGVGAAAGEMQKMAQDMETMMEDEFYEPSEEVRDLTFSLPHYLALRTKDEFFPEKDNMMEDLEELFGEKMENINTMLDMQFPKDEIGTEIKKVLKMKKLTKEEVEKLLERIGSTPEEDDRMVTFEKEFSAFMEEMDSKTRDLKIRYTRG